VSDETILSEAKEAFELAKEREDDNRNEALDDLKFARLGEQWPEQVRRQRELEGRPCLTINRLPAHIRQVVNDGRQNKPAISVHPVDSNSDPETAEIFNGLIRQIEQSSDAEVAYDTALDFAVTMGFGYFKVNTRYAKDDGLDQDICIERVSNPFCIYGDPESTAADSADWNTAFEMDTMSVKAFEKRWPKAEATSFDDDGADKSKSIEQNSITVASYWSREENTKTIVALSDGTVLDEDVYAAQKDVMDALGLTVAGSRQVTGHKVTQRLLNGSEVLETVDWAGKYIPIIPVYGEDVNVEGRRYLRSLVRDAKDPARNFNYWRTAATELVALAPKTPFIGKKGAFETDAAKWATANTQSHSYIEYDGPEGPQRQPFVGVPAGALQEALNAADDMKAVMGMFDASLGAKSNETSGKAIMARQREGDVGSFHYIDNLSRAIRHCGRIIVDLIPHVYSVPRIVRTLGPQGEQQEVVVAPKSYHPGPGGAPSKDRLPPEMQQVAERNAQMAQKAQQEKAEQDEQAAEIKSVFDVTAGKYDVTVKVGPSFTSQREEAATQMIELIRAYPDAAPILGDLLVQNLDWPGADKVSERLAKLLPPQISGKGNPEAEQVKQQAQEVIQGITQQAQQIQSEAQQAAEENQRLKQEIAQLKLNQQAELLNLRIKAFDADTKRMSVAQAGQIAQQNAIAKASESEDA
jgi:hypothetical protein